MGHQSTTWNTKNGDRAMNAPLSVRLDEEVRAILGAEAEMRGIGLSTYLRQLAEAEAVRLRRERIRAASEAVAHHIASSAEAREFSEDWGTPSGFGRLSD
jgi:hypothetical protein